MDTRTAKEIEAFDEANTVGKLAKVLLRAKKAAMQELMDGDITDGGSCNLDTPAFRVERMPQKVIETAAKLAGVTVTQFDWMGRQKWYWLNVHSAGQGDRRTRIATAAQRVLDEAKKVHEVPGLASCMYQQAD